jgi:hypothetical protein
MLIASMIDIIAPVSIISHLNHKFRDEYPTFSEFIRNLPIG